MKTSCYSVSANYKVHTNEEVWTASDRAIEHTVEIETIETDADITDDIAAEILDLMAHAYSHQFERAGPRMPEFTFDYFFDSTDAAKVHTQVERMREAVSKDSVYGLAYNPEVDVCVGLVKASPSRASQLQKLGLKSPNVYLNDIVVDPVYQGLRFASVALFNVLTSGRFDAKRALMLDGFVGNNLPNQWFGRLGLQKVAVDLEPFVVDKKQGLFLPQERYSSEGHATIGDIAERLQKANDIVVEEAGA